MQTTLDMIRKILSLRNRQYHGGDCGFCHGSGSNNSCPKPERNASWQSDGELLDAINDALDMQEDLPVMTEIEKSWDKDE